MKCTIRGVIVFLAAFLVGSAVVPAPPILDVPAVSDEVVITQPVAFYPKPETPPVRPDYQFVLVIRRHDPEFEIEERRIAVESDGPRETNIDLELGESIENQLVYLHSPDQKLDYKIEQQFETSMAIGDEGPHYDMTHWKHYTSPWTEITRVSHTRFVTSKLSEADNSRFPNVTRDEIVSAFKKDGADNRWLDLARSCAGPNGGPCYVSVNRISLRISVKEENKWKPVHTLNFSIPMGC